MSSHRKIEYTLFVLGLFGLVLSGFVSTGIYSNQICLLEGGCTYLFGLPACYLGTILFALVSVFSGLHVFHLFDGKRANEIVLVSSLLGLLSTGYLVFNDFSVVPNACDYGFIIFLALTSLSFRLRQDFSGDK